MIRFIATDLDGTLLDSERRLPEEIFPLIGKLKELGVLFAPASRHRPSSGLLKAPNCASLPP